MDEKSQIAYLTHMIELSYSSYKNWTKVSRCKLSGVQIMNLIKLMWKYIGAKMATGIILVKSSLLF